MLYSAKNAPAPPWEVFPTYERHSLGWRMGNGEDYKYDWWNYVESLPSNFESRFKYLKRNRPAPINWFSTILEVLYPEQDNDPEYEESDRKIKELLELGLIKHDVTFETWLQQQTEIIYPWTLAETPEEAVRHWTREFWFFSRQLNRDHNIEILNIPDAWKNVEYNLMSGKIDNIDPAKGLLTIAKMFCAGNILTPWQLGLNPTSEDSQSFKMDMGYTDAYGMWLMFAFDDDYFIRKMLAKNEIPDEWNEWIEDKIQFIFF